MKISDCADKIAGLIAYLGWGALVAGKESSPAFVEPLSSAVILASQFALQLSSHREDACASAINRIRMQTERAIEREIGTDTEFSEPLRQAFVDFDRYLPQIYPSMTDLVQLWRLEPKAIANGLLARLSERSEAIALNHLARQAIEHIIVQAIEAFKDDPVFFQKLQPTIARQMLADLGGLQETLDSVAVEQRRQSTVLERIAAQLEIRGGGAALHAKISHLEREIDLGESDLIEVLRGIVDRGVKADQIVPTLTTIGKNLNSSRAELAQLDSLSLEVPEIASHVTAARAALDKRDKLDLGVAQREIREARGTYRQSVLTRRHAEAVNLARFAETEASIAMARFDYPEAASLFAEAACELPEAESHSAAKLRTKQADALYEHGTRLYDATSLTQAIQIYELVLTMLSNNERGLAPAWAKAQNNLGNAFQRLADCVGGEAGRAYVERAIGAYRAALSVRTGNVEMRSDWAMTQNGLASALQRLGGIDNLRQAREACNLALSIHKRKDVPARWAMTKNNLGNVLRSLGESEGESIDRLNEAAKVYGDALTVLSPDDVPVQWAMTHNNLGDVLQSIGDRTEGETGTSRFMQAIDAHKAALSVLSADSMPALWAISKNSLGMALQRLGERLGGSDAFTLIADAVDAYREALVAYPDEGVGWATTQNNLGIALLKLGVRAGHVDGRERFVQASEAFNSALVVFVERDMPAERMATENNLQIALKKINGTEV